MSDSDQVRIARLRELSEQIAATSRRDPPPEDEADLWSVAIDQDTNQPSWGRKDLLEEFWRLRFPGYDDA